MRLTEASTQMFGGRDLVRLEVVVPTVENPGALGFRHAGGLQPPTSPLTPLKKNRVVFIDKSGGSSKRDPFDTKKGQLA
jgi:hypothetical protein